MTLRFSPEDHARVRDAIARAETRTSAEIYAVFARSSGENGGFGAAAIAVAALIPAAFAATLILELAGRPVGGVEATGILFIVAALLSLALAALPGLRRRLVPAGFARARASRMAAAQFLAHNLHVTADRTGVLLFVSEAERHAEVIADAGIAAHVDQDTWDEVVAGLVEAAREDRLADGFADAVTYVGEILAGSFPPRVGVGNEIPDRLVEI
ncbi:TPM domain-containing protein [Aureimonas sp. ME7]|uniref:TPM domain-containing protein n=1 Tax=Aureimonas sp. ME7 TaxID=2744252 RepID=UPI0015F5F368|nr:TPM domain-containing protein [Aureimonas sp. ME7]